MFSFAANALSRTSSVSSVASDDSLASSSAHSVISVEAPAGDTVKRTRKRFTSAQLMMLEHLYGQASHPTREQREQVAREAHIDIRSVTVWFQNKRQTDRRISRHALQAPPGSQPALSVSASASLSFSPSPSNSQPSPTSLLPPSSPFSDASGNTIHTARARTRTRTRTLSSDSSTSAMSALSRKREREHENDAKHPPVRHIRRKPSHHLSLDDVAARAERPALLPRTPPQALVPPTSPPVRPVTPDLKPAPSVTTAATGKGTDENACGDTETENTGQRALWENMPSSPIAPDEPLPVHPSEAERDIVRYGGGGGGRRRITLEYACAREAVGVDLRGWEWNWLDGRDADRPARARRGLPRRPEEREKKGSRSREGKSRHRRRVDTLPPLPCTRTHTQQKGQDQDEDEEDIPVADYDVYGGGDTDTEGAPSEPPVTPSSSFSLGELHHMDREEDEAEDGDSDRTVTVQLQREVLGRARGKKKLGVDGPMAVPRIQGGPDDDSDLMDVAYVLCGLSQGR